MNPQAGWRPPARLETPGPAQRAGLRAESPACPCPPADSTFRFPRLVATVPKSGLQTAHVR